MEITSKRIHRYIVPFFLMSIAGVILTLSWYSMLAATDGTLSAKGLITLRLLDIHPKSDGLFKVDSADTASLRDSQSSIGAIDASGEPAAMSMAINQSN